jgi:hypothetical protein
MDALRSKAQAQVVSPSEVQAKVAALGGVVPSEHDIAALERLAAELNARAIIWGSVDQFTPYSFNRLMPATPPYVELTITAFRAGSREISSASARKQGATPGTIWSRQPTFSDVAAEALGYLIERMR